MCGRVAWCARRAAPASITEKDWRVVIAADALETGKVLQLKALAFGALASVHGWERFAVGIQRILVTLFRSW